MPHQGSAAPQQAPQPQAAPPLFWDSDGAEKEPRRPGRGRTVLLAVAAVLIFFLAGFGVWFALADRTEGGGNAAPSDSTPDAGSGGPEIGSVQEVGGVSYTLEAAGVEETCADHAYGRTAAHFADETECTGLARALYSAQVGGLDVVVSVARVRMPDTAAARELRGLTDTSGTGNVNDLLKDGVTYPGGPAELSGAEYASAVSGPTVTIVESAWVDPDAGGTDAEIDQIATSGLSLATPPVPGA